MVGWMGDIACYLDQWSQFNAPTTLILGNLHACWQVRAAEAALLILTQRDKGDAGMRAFLRGPYTLALAAAEDSRHDDAARMIMRALTSQLTN